MTLSNLSVGNLVSLAYNPEVLTTVIAIEYGGSVQVACNNYADDIRDIIAIPLNKEILTRFNIPVTIKTDTAQVYITCRVDKVFFSTESNSNVIQVAYLHQLQNLVSFLAGIDIIDHRKFRI